MSQQSRQFDFWYAVQNTKIVRGPSRALETFGATRINYHHLAELPDDPRKVRVREGRLEAHKPAIITPEEYAEADIDAIASFLAAVSPDIPLHVTRFFPRFRLLDVPPTPVATIQRLADVARTRLRRVLVGNC